MAGSQLSIPVDGESKPLQLLPHRGDVLIGPDAGFNSPLDGRIFGW